MLQSSPSSTAAQSLALVAGSAVGSDGTVFYVIGSATGQSPSGLVLSVVVSPQDLNNIKRLAPGLCTSTVNCFLSIGPGVVASMTGVPSAGIASTGALRVAAFGVESTPPMLVSFTLDMQAQVLNLTFTRTVNTTTLRPQLLTLQRTLDGRPANRSLSLSSATVLNPSPDTLLSLALDDADVNRLLALRIAVDINSTFVSVQPGVVLGITGLSLNTTHTLANGLQATVFTANARLPVLRSFSVNMNAGTLSLTFSMTVVASTLNISGLRLASGLNVSGSNNASSSLSGPAPRALNEFAPTPSSLVVSGMDSPVVLVQLSTPDLNAIKAADSLLRARNSSFLQLAAGAVLDANGNPSVFAMYRMAAAFVEDVTPPALTSFRMDQNVLYVNQFANQPSMLVVLQFSESVRLSTLTPSALVFQSAASSAAAGAQSFALTNASVIYPNKADPTTVMFKLTLADANSIKLLAGLCKNRTTCFLSLASTLIADMAGNSVVPVSAASGMQAAVFTADATAPSLLRFAMDLSLGRMVLFFDEPVRGSSFIPTQVTLQNAVQRASKNLTLTGALGLTRTPWRPSDAAGFEAPNGTTLMAYLTLADLNQIKAMHFCTQPDDCYLVHGGLMVRDIAGNAIIPCV